MGAQKILKIPYKEHEFETRLLYISRPVTVSWRMMVMIKMDVLDI
jgi:hypothetical protein